MILLQYKDKFANHLSEHQKDDHTHKYSTARIQSSQGRLDQYNRKSNSSLTLIGNLLQALIELFEQVEHSHGK